MTLTEQILQRVQTLSGQAQAEVLDFVDFLDAKARHRGRSGEDKEWSALSLSSAMRGMEDEPSPYSLDDLKEVFK